MQCNFQVHQKIISEELLYKSIHMKVEDLKTHPFGLVKDIIKSALEGLHKMKIIEKYKK